MAKAKKEVVEIHQEEVVETPVEDTTEIVEEKVVESLFGEKKDESIPELPKGETEVDFLQRILNIQHIGGFGRHLDDIIYDRIKFLNSAK